MPTLLHAYLSRLALLLALAISTSCQRPAATSTAAACIDPAKANPGTICTTVYDPVCGCDGKTYSSACVADRSGVRTYTKGPCPSSK